MAYIAGTLTKHLGANHVPATRQIRNRSILLAAITLLLLSGAALLIDAEITRNRRSDFVSGDFRRIIQLSEVFAHGFGIAIALYLLWLLSPDRRKAIPRLATCVILPGLVVHVCKLLIARRRPGFYYPEFTDQIGDTWVGLLVNWRLNTEYVTQSFPSAHAATAIGMAVGLSWLFPQARYLFAGLGILSAFQRVVAGAHWTSDVLAGAAVGVLVCGFIFNSRGCNRFFARFEQPPDNGLDVEPMVCGKNDTDFRETAKAA